MTRKQARIQRKNANSLHVIEAEVQRHHINDRDHAVAPHHVLEEKVEMIAAGVENVARKEVPGIEVPEMMQKNPSTTAPKDVVIVIVVLLMVLKRKANLLQPDKEMQTVNQMMMDMNQNWQEMRAMHLMVMKVALRVRTRDHMCNINTEQLID